MVEIKKIAIISFFHSESSLCLAKYLAKHGCCVDYYLITDIIHDNGTMSGVEYIGAPKYPGIHQLKEKEAPELYKWSEGLSVSWHLLRIWWFSPKAKLFNAPIWRNSLRYIRNQHYDAIDIVGQHPWVAIIHNALKGENITHTLHEVGSHQNGITSTSLMELIASDQSKVICHSNATLERFLNIPKSNKDNCKVIPFGKFETSLLYGRDIEINHGLNLSKTTFLFYGFIKPYKGLDLLAEAMKLLTPIHETFNLIIAGGGYDINIAYFRSLDNCFVLNRFLTNDEMMKLNRICSAVVLPYHSASQTGIIPTCFLYGKPVIATAVGAFVENVTNKKNGLLIEPENPGAFAEAMRMCIEDNSFLAKLSNGAMQFGHGDEYDWNVIARKTIDFIK